MEEIRKEKMSPRKNQFRFPAVGLTVLLLWAALPGGGGWLPLLGLACVPLFVCICQSSRRQAMFLGLSAGFFFFLAELYWIVSVLGQYGGLPLYLSLPALLLLSLYMACYMMIFAWLANVFVNRFSFALCLWLLPAAWTGLDWLRSFAGSGFPWMDLGYGVTLQPVLMQAADIAGHYGLTFLVILLNTLFAFVCLHRKDTALCLRLTLPVAALLLMAGGYSVIRWQQISAEEGGEALNIAVVQSNVDQAQKWNPARQQQTILDFITLSSQVMKDSPRPDLVVWPETALPFFPVHHPLLAPIADFLKYEKVMLLTGAPWYERPGNPEGKVKFFNSSHLFDTTGEIVGMTSKTHLVPFGEYVPMQDLLPFIAPLVEAAGDFTAGRIQSPPACQKANIGVLICFESIFPEISRKWVDTGANILINITNDAWYGRSSAPYQTLAMTRMRAVETRRSIVRSANTGFSAFIDPLGRLLQLSPLFEPWQAVERMPLREGRTLFVRGGYLFAPLCFVFAFLGLAAAVFGKGKMKHDDH